LLKEKLQRIEKERVVQRKGRGDLLRVALVGYTNAGKSTLFKLFSGSDVLVEDKLFATLDTTVRRITLSPSKDVLLSDTVGFIRKLPAHLIASFKSTLAEAVEADVLLHVVDVSHPRHEDQIRVVKETLESLNAGSKPTVTVLNKIDKVEDRSGLKDLLKVHEPAVGISATRGINISGLKEKVLALAEHDTIQEVVLVKQSDYKTIAKLHDIAEVVDKSYENESVRITYRIGRKNLDRVKKLLNRSSAGTHVLDSSSLSEG
jgi:GTP-binding protein HflX